MINFFCPKCNKFINVKNDEDRASHLKKCNQKSLTHTMNWEYIQEQYNKWSSWEYICKKFHIARRTIDTARKNGLLYNVPYKMPDELRRQCSEKRKEWLKNNPNEHYWKRCGKFVSVPCEYFKDILRNNNISFIEEYQPLSNRAFSIDISFPNDKIGIEINGNQHYNRDGSLKEYYQNRHNLIENDGWKLYEIPYIKVYDNKFVEEFINSFKNKIDLSIEYKPIIKDKHRCIDCNKIIKKPSIRCKRCYIKHRVVENAKNRVSKEQLIKDIQSMSMVKVGKKYGVSDNAVKKWCINYGIYELRKNKIKKNSKNGSNSNR